MYFHDPLRGASNSIITVNMPKLQEIYAGTQFTGTQFTGTQFGGHNLPGHNLRGAVACGSSQSTAAPKNASASMLHACDYVDRMYSTCS
jgi:hypothetical protein